MVDITANAGWLSCTLRVIHLIQMLIQGQWINEHELLTIPNVNKSNLGPLLKELLRNDKLRHLHVDTLVGFKYAATKHPNLFENALLPVYGLKTMENIAEHLFSLPSVDISLTIVNSEKTDNIKLDLNSSVATTLQHGSEYEFLFSFNRKSADDKLAVHSKKFPKKKDESWFLCIGTGNDLLNIKRIVIRKRTEATVKVTIPKHLGNYTYTVYLLSDSYLGLDQQYEIPLQVKN